MVAYWAGRYAEAVRYAEMGTEFAGQGGGTASVWLPISAARAYAALGNSERALSAIHTAEDAWETVEPDAVDELGGICTFNQPRTLYYAADALAWLPAEANSAVLFSTRAVAAYTDHSDPAWAIGDEAGSHADLAIARIASREIEGARDAIAPVLELAPEQRINGTCGGAGGQIVGAASVSCVRTAAHPARPFANPRADNRTVDSAVNQVPRSGRTGS